MPAESKLGEREIRAMFHMFAMQDATLRAFCAALAARVGLTEEEVCAAAVAAMPPGADETALRVVGANISTIFAMAPSPFTWPPQGG